MKKFAFVIVLFIILSFLSFKNYALKNSIIGFNQNWAFLPKLDNNLLLNIKSLKPEMIRYPGGTLTHKWNWKTGKKKGLNNSNTHPIEDIKKLVDATNVEMIYVLDIVHSTIDDQLLMLNSIKELGLAIKYIELGNELYSKDENYVQKFPSGKEYAEKAKKWTLQLKEKYPNAKISAVLQCRNSKSKNRRFNEWNLKVINGTEDVIDAYTYHVYIAKNGTFKSRKLEFNKIINTAGTGSKELWITEYGNQNHSSQINYYSALDSLANFIENHPKVTISLNHNIVGNAKNKITSDGNSFTTEGQLFLSRLKK
ncbi:glycosyl hydrolase [Lutibacter citreus]|uniref:glycosyl hydrolase n=1 Tax=Lutibacter citreus TaxID=2138210 RepID=UPI000DBE51E1|nr:glycosyl hydrolase [Lutibacter citreus]